MADEKVKENVAPSQTEESKEALKKEKDLRGELGKLDKKKANHSIDEALKKAPDIIKERMKEAFEKFKEENGIEAEKEEDLTDEQKKEFKEFTKNIPQEVFEETRDEVIKISGDRLTKINEIQEEARKLKEIVDAELAQRNAELSQIEDQNSPEYKKLQDEIAKIEALQKDLDPDGREKTNIFGQLNRATNTQKSINAHAYAGMITTFEDYPQVKVTSDPKLNKDILENSREEGYNKQVQENEKENAEQVAPQEEKNENQRVVPVQGNNQQQVKSGNAPEGVAQNFVPEENNAVEQPEAQEEPKELSNLDLLGYNPDNILDFDRSVELLEKFADGDLTDKKRLEMLNDPECKDVILQALEKAGEVKHGKKARMFNDTRYKIVKLAKGSMMEAALKDYAGDNLEGRDIKVEFEKLNNEYEEKRDKINALLEENPNDIVAKQKLEDLDKQYMSIINVSDFKTSSKEIETLGTKFREFCDEPFFKKREKVTDQKALPPANQVTNSKPSAYVDYLRKNLNDKANKKEQELQEAYDLEKSKIEAARQAGENRIAHLQQVANNSSGPKNLKPGTKFINPNWVKSDNEVAQFDMVRDKAKSQEEIIAEKDEDVR